MIKRLIIGCVFIFFLSACSTRGPSSVYVDTRSTNRISYDYQRFPYNNHYDRARFTADSNYYYLDTDYMRSSGYVGLNTYGFRHHFRGDKSLLLADIVSNMSDQLLHNLPYGYSDEAVAVTSLVDLSEHSQTNWLGQTISELFIHELYIRKLPIIDFKLTGNIKVTPKGEFALTRDWKKLNKNVDVQRILTGTMSRNEEGVILNIRIVNSVTNLVESTTRAFIPHELFVGGKYDYHDRKYYLRDSLAINEVKLVR